MVEKYVFLFSEGNAQMRDILGGKGANLAEMTGLGLPVPQGFTVSAQACTKYYADGGVIDKEILSQISEYVKKVEKINNKEFGNPENPLLFSVRSGAAVSMPGMMDTVLNLGLNFEIVKGLAKITGNERFAYDSFRRFVQMFSDVVFGIDKSKFEKVIDEVKAARGIKADTELNTDDLKKLVMRFTEIFKEETGKDFPTDPNVQLIEAIKAVFRSRYSDRAVIYCRENNIPMSMGTAVNVQPMVFGNSGDKSGTGVAFTRDPATGENKLFGEFLINAQGEDVVAGIRTPLPISALKEIMPKVYDQFLQISKTLEKRYKDMQDMEFTVENEKLYMLQTRSGKRTAAAALKIALDLLDEGIINEKEAVMKANPRQLEALLHPAFDEKALKSASPAAVGLPASPGAACGQVCFYADDAKELAKNKIKNILVRLETSPEDIAGMYAAEGILTVRGGKTSHAAVVARGMGKCCVSGCGSITVNEKEGFFTVNGQKVRAGDIISLDGSTGNVYIGEIPTVPADISGDFERFMKIADKYRTMKVLTNADTPADAAQAVKFGAAGLGLCRTEHMFFGEDRISAMREMIIARTKEKRQAALLKILPMQMHDFESIFTVMDGLPVTVRFLDPPLREFLPTEEKEINALAKTMEISPETLKSAVDSLCEINPMMGHRGCRLAVSYPEIAVMQTKAVINAAVNAEQKGVKVLPEIMIPLVCDCAELKAVKEHVVKTADEIIKERNSGIKYKVGTMIEIPRAAITAGKIASEAEFFSFGTNDLTQMTYGFSRDDAGKFLDFYYRTGIFETDPFSRLDEEGVGELIRLAVKAGRKTRPNMKMGICGEHGGDPESIDFCYRIGLDYVSCSPFRVPAARLAAAQSAIRAEK